MDHMTTLEQMRHQMIEELTQIPQYRALRLLERFLGELAAIYEEPLSADPIETKITDKRIAQAIEKHMRADSPLIVKNPAHMSVQRVA